MEQTRGLFCACDSDVAHCQSLLAAVNQIYVIQEAINGCKKKSIDSLKDCFENVNFNY